MEDNSNMNKSKIEDNKREKSKLENSKPEESKPSEESKPEESKPEENKPEGLSTRSTDETLYKPRRATSFLFVKRASVRYDDDDEGIYLLCLYILYILYNNHNNNNNHNFHNNHLDDHDHLYDIKVEDHDEIIEVAHLEDHHIELIKDIHGVFNEVIHDPDEHHDDDHHHHHDIHENPSDSAVDDAVDITDTDTDVDLSPTPLDQNEGPPPRSGFLGFLKNLYEFTTCVQLDMKKL